jgi:chromosome segregation ATPase
MSSTQSDVYGEAYLDTVSLLQEEIARLEAELLMRDVPAPQSVPDRAAQRQSVAAEARILELTSLVAERDETMGLLWDQLSALEEVEAARKAEFEQLNRWVEELEQRMKSEASRPADLDVGRQEAEALRDQLESQRRSWETQRSRLFDEIGDLRARLEESACATGGGSAAQRALEEENRKLRDECRRLAIFEPDAQESASLREQLGGLRGELDRARQELDLVSDDLRRERLEREADQAASRARQATERITESAPATSDERVRALREHLREMHDRDEQERRERQLSTRISRLWHRSGSRR